MPATLWEYEQDFIRMMSNIKQRGIKIDSAFSRKKVIEGNKVLNSIRSDLGWNPGSSQQLGHYLIEDLGLPVLKRTPAGAPSMDKNALEEYEQILEHRGDTTAQKVLTYRGWQKTVSSNFQAYLDLMDENEILHPNYKVHGTRTSRLSCEKPNLQQIPRDSPKPWNGDCKKAFIPRRDSLLLFNLDFKQLEFRLASAYAKEEELLEIFNSGADIFAELSETLGKPRYLIKTFIYMTLYGAGKKKIGLVMGRDHADELYENFHERWPGFRKISNRATQLAKNQGYVKYWTGRRRHLNTLDAHKAFNSIVQGGGFEIVKRRMLDLQDEPIVLQVHDSVTIEAPGDYDIERVKRIMESVPEANEFGVKFDVDLEVMAA